MTASVTVRRMAGLLLAVAILCVGCGEDVEVSRDEAVEVLVLDGVPRDRAECIVDGVDGTLAFAKVTGVDPDIDEDELAELARISATCVFDDDGAVGILEGESVGLEEAEGGGGLAFDIEAEIERLIEAGISADVATCVGLALAASPDPAAAVAGSFLTEAIRVCDGDG